MWCVFDKDSFGKEQFNTAIQMAEKYGFRVAYSNEAFELWYILHFEYWVSGVDRKAYLTKLAEFLGEKYKKSDTFMYSKLLSMQKKAIRNAKKLLNQYPSTPPADNKPSTTVHLLVEELNKYKR